MPHTRKILSQAGTSLADVYDVEGSVVGLEALEVSEIKGVHDLGPQIHSERLNVFNLIATSGVLLQDTNWDITLAGFPDSINRVLSVSVIADVGVRVSYAAVHIRDASPNGNDHPIWIWDSTDDVESLIRLANPAIGVQSALRPLSDVAGGLPTMLARTGVVSRMSELTFRGRTLGFGAGNVTVQALIQVIRPDHGNPPPGAPSSHGLPIPSW